MTETPRHQRRVIRSERVKIGAPADRIVNGVFGGLMNFCSMTGLHSSTVHNWLRSGLIPAKWHEPGLSYQRFIQKVAHIHGLSVPAEFFIEEEPEEADGEA